MKKTMHEYKLNKLRSGSGKPVKSRKQAIAIGLSQARKVCGSRSVTHPPGRKRTKRTTRRRH